MQDYLPIVFLGFSLSVNLGLILKLLNLREDNLRLSKEPERKKSIELQEFLVDLLSGPAMIAIARVDQSNILMRSPKQK